MVDSSTTMDSNIHTPVSTNAPTQADDLPAEFPVSLDGIDKLTNAEQVTSWSNLLKRTLTMYDLKPLIDYNLPRPKPDDPNYKTWRKLSLRIGTWITLQLERSVFDRLEQQPGVTDYADDTYKVILQMMNAQEEVHSIQFFLAATNLSVDDFPTMEDFVLKFQELIKRANLNKTPITPYTATLMLFEKVRTELPTWVESVEQNQGSILNEKMTEEQFIVLCKQAIVRGSRKDKSFAAQKSSTLITESTPASTPNRKERGRSRKSRNRGIETDEKQSYPRINRPPPGTNITEYVREWLNSTEQRVNGRCTFCYADGHDCAVCWRLRPDLRSEEWKPYNTKAWIYEGKPILPDKDKKPTTTTPNMQVANMATEADTFDFSFSGMAIPNKDPSSYPSHKRWLADSGSSYFICSEMSAMTEYQPFGGEHEHPNYETSDGSLGKGIEGRGKCVINLDMGNGITNSMIINCYYNPRLSCNIFSTSKSFKTLGIWHNAKENTLLALDNDQVIGYTYRLNDLPFLKIYQPDLSCATIDAETIHRRYAHCGKPKLKESHSNTNLTNMDFHCDACNMSKAKRIVSHAPRVRSRKVGNLFYADVQSVKPTSIEGYNYFLVIVDDKSRQTFTIHLMTKGQASDALIHFCKEYKLKSPLHIYPVKWKLDGGKEFKRFRKWAIKKGMEMEINPPRTPEMNGVPERIGGYLTQTARTMIIDSRLPPKLWPYAVETAAYIINRLPNTTIGDKPLVIWRRELLINQDVSLDHVRIWGSKAYVHIPKKDRVQAEKMAPRAFLGHLVGYEGDHGHVYKVWIPSTNQVKRSRDVIIKERWKPEERDSNDDDDDVQASIPQSNNPIQPNNKGGSVRLDTTSLEPHQPRPVQTIEDREPECETGRVQTLSPTPMLTMPVEHGIHEVLNPTTTSEHNPPQPNDRPQRVRKEPQRLINELARDREGKVDKKQGKKTSSSKGGTPAPTDEQLTTPIPEGSYAAMQEERIPAYKVKIPKTYQEAMETEQSKMWKTAMDDQITKLHLAKTWEEVDPSSKSPYARVLPGKWVFDVKTDAENFIIKYRARWVICGNRQRAGHDFDETYSPVVSETTVKVVLSLIAIHNLYAEQFDFVTAYLNAQLLDRKIYMRSPTGYNSNGKTCLLLRALYGLKQSGFLWNDLLSKELEKLGFRQLREDPCVFVKETENSFIIIYVDDGIIAAPTKKEVDEIKRRLNEMFKLKELGRPDKFLGCHLLRDENKKTITLSQSPYIAALLREHGLQHANGTKIPMTPSYIRVTERNNPVDALRYQHLTGQLNWLTTKTRPDISYALARLQKKNSMPDKIDEEAAKSLLRYLKNHKNLGIELGIKPDEGLAAYVDASFGDNDDGKSTNAYVITFAGAPISWSSKKQTFTATSTTVAEFAAFTPVVKEILWLRKLLTSLGTDQQHPTPIYSDSDNAIDILKRPGYKSSVKWIDTRYFFVRDEMEKR